MDSESDWDNCSVFSIALSLSSYDDCDEAVYLDSLLSYRSWPEDIESSYYDHCDSLSFTSDTLLAMEVEKDDDCISWKFAPYRDLRSAARSQRPRKRQDRRRCHSCRCRKQGQAEADIRNMRAKREIERCAVAEAQRDSFDGSYCHMQWDIHLPEENDEMTMELNEIERYIYHNQNAHVFESPEPYGEVGEDFSTWCQRRINEMRSVKEARIRANLPSVAKPMIWHRKTDGGYLMRFDIYTGDETTTTLPTNAYDALGHELLRNISTPTPHQLRKQPIEGFRWFGEYEWEWYREEYGIWKIRYWGPYHESKHVDADECEGCDGGRRIVGKECICGGTGSKPDPDEAQRCSLLEWIGEKGRDLVSADEKLVYFLHDRQLLN